MHYQTKLKLIDYLIGFISEARKQRFDEVIAQRTDHIRVVIENVFQEHNASAVLRTCDCFGIQNVHVIENYNGLRLSADVALGSSNWLTIHRHNEFENNTKNALLQLKDSGYKIVATTPHKNDYTIDNLPVSEKFALVFGTELEGITEDVINIADTFVRIPMFGFTESFNVSVSAALCLHETTKRSRQSVKNYYLSDEQKIDVYLNWLKNSVQKSKGLIEKFLDEID
jgi:tRNA (guanosine-2'-O-)-methyltransferase